MLGEKYSRGKIQKGNYLIAQGQFSHSLPHNRIDEMGMNILRFNARKIIL